jgi:AcrR family transcriptional regulator
MSEDQNTETIILEAARKIFISKGFDGARMQEIADEAGINKSLLHYYFRSKDKLFEAIFVPAMAQVQANLMVLVNEERPFLEKLEDFIDQYLDILEANPYLPAFVSHEVNRNPDRMYVLIKGSGLQPSLFTRQVEDEVAKGTIHAIHPEHLIINMISLCAFPYIARPMFERLIFGNNKEKITLFAAMRREDIKNMVIRSLKK